MIYITRGDIFDSDADVIVDPVNTVGVSGAGLAKQFAARYPKENELYKQGCRNGSVRIGSVLLVESSDGRHIAYFPTKTHWRLPSETRFISEGLIDLRRKVEAMGLNSIALPALGCGLGGLDLYRDVFPEMESVFSDSDIEVTVYLRP